MDRERIVRQFFVDSSDEEDIIEDVIINPGVDIVEAVVNAVANVEDPQENLLQINPRNNDIVNLRYYEVIVPMYNDQQFQSHFRMSRETFNDLENVIGPHIVNDANIQVNIRNEIPLRKKILMTLWIIATPESFRSVCDRFGMSKSRAHSTFKEVLIVLKNLMLQFVQWPDAEQRAESERVFRIRSRGFPGVIGTIDGCHVPMKQPPRNANDYYNRKQFHSIILQGTCDHSGKFIDCLIGRPGRMHDAAVFCSSTLYRRLTNAEDPLLPPNKHILGDSAYPLLQNLMTPFRENGHLTEEQTRYNVSLSSIRSVIERGFGLLKGKWRRLRYLDVKSVEMANSIVAAACTLHNFLLIHGDVDIVENHNINDFVDNIEQHHDNMNDYDDMLIDDNARAKRIHIMNGL